MSRDENTGDIRNTPETRASVSAKAGAPTAAKLVRISTARRYRSDAVMFGIWS
jgi:hypothetical protein